VNTINITLDSAELTSAAGDVAITMGDSVLSIDGSDDDLLDLAAHLVSAVNARHEDAA
jgi:hypothetical protein